MTQDEPHRSTRWARWGMLLVSLAMGVALVVSALFVWDDSKTAARSVAEARTMDLFRAVRRALRDAVLDGTVGATGKADLAGLKDEFAEAGLRYVGVFDRDGDLRFEAGTALGELSPTGPRPKDMGEPRPVVVGERIRLDAPLMPRPGWRGRGPRLIIEVDPILARSLEQTAERQLVVSGVVALVLVGMALVFWRLMRKADRLELARAHERRLAALGGMSAVLGHELRNPLASLKGHAQLALEKTGEGERSRKNLERVVAESERLERLMNQILEFTRTGHLDIGEHSPRELVMAVVEATGDGRVVAEVSAAPETWRLDRARMEQVLTNLVANAREHAPEGAIRVIAERRGRELVLEVRDGGAGFAPDEHGRLDWVFEPFQTAGKVYGTGLGLAIARQIVQAHGGRIAAKNDGGGVVTIALPSGP